MAERNHLKIASQNDIADDDPFAELTKIMGFDPREPSRPQAAQEPEGDGFDIDLEKELMGEFDALDDAPAEQAAPVENRVDDRHEPAFEAADDSAFEEGADELSLSLDDEFLLDEPDAAAGEIRGATSDAFALPENEQAETGPVEDDFEDAVARSFESDFNAPAEEPLQFDADEEDDFDAEQIVEPEALAEPAFAQPADPVASEPSEDDLDDAVFDDFEFEAELPAQQAVDTAVQDDDRSLDSAMADVGLDFDMPSPELAGEPALEAEDAVAEEDGALLPADAQSMELADDLDLGMDLDDAFADLAESDLGEPDLVETLAAAPAYAAPVEPAAAAAVAEDDNSLEDELNALLNRMSARPAAQPEVVAAPPVTASDSAPPVVAEADSIDDFDAAAWDLDIAADQDEPQADIEEDIDPALLADLEAVDFSDMEIDAAEADDGEGDEGEALGAADADFDENDFDAELDKHFGSVGVVAPAVASAAAVSAAAMPAWQTSAPPRADASWQMAASSTTTPVAAAASYPASTSTAKTAQYEDMPDVETIDVPERVVALVDDLDLPEVAFEEAKTDAASYDDLDAEFSSILNEMNAGEPSSPRATGSYDDDAYGAGYQRGAAASVYAAAPDAATASGSEANDPLDDFDLDSFGGNRAAAADDDAFDYDPDLDQSMDIAAASEAEQARPRNRLLLWAGAVAAIAVVGGVGAFALSFGSGSGSEAPAIVKADNQPIKVKPENPGGAVIPNQDNKVYDAVSKGAAPSEPSQQNLVTNTEEPVDVTAKAEPRVVGAAPETDEAAAPTGKSEDRIEQVLQEDAANGGEDTALVTPRKVRTMVVKPDGSLVPREDPAPAQVSASEPADPAPQLVATVPDATGAVNPQTNINELKPAAPQGEGAAPVAANAPEAAGQSALTPSVAPIAPQRPSDQPIDVVGEVKADQVAAINPAASTAVGGAWSMQIASQPTADSAQSTYQDLARRYSSVLNGRGVNIVKAEIAGKGTFYRVRVPAPSRNDAVELCTSYKAAGGNCFVSK